MHSKPTAEIAKRLEPAKPKTVPQARRASKTVSTPERAQSPPLAYSKETLEPRLELLHAHVVHRSSNKVQDEWKSSAYRHYEKQFTALKKRSLELDEKEKDILEQKNAAAILSWANQAEGVTIEQQVHRVSAIVDEVWRLSAPDGKYTLAIQAFQHWYEAAGLVQSQRRSDRNARARMDVIEGLGDGWKAETSTLQRTILNAANDVVTLGEISSEGSDLQRCITLVSESLTHMLEELELVGQIEECIVREEREWVQGSINNIALDLKDGLALR